MSSPLQNEHTAPRRRRPAEGSLRDLRHALRTLRGSPGFTAVAVLTLTLGIGANTAIFSIVNGIILRPLPYPEPQRIVQIWEHNDSAGTMSSAWTNFVDWRAESRSFEAMASYGAWVGTVLGGDEPLRAGVAAVSGGFFRVMGTQPAMGRGFNVAEHVVGAEPVAVVGHAFWQDQLGGAADLSDIRLTVEGFTVSIVGVAPAGFEFPVGTDVWYPLELVEQTTSRTAHNYRVVGRLAAGVDASHAEEELGLITARFPGAGEPDDYMPQRARVISLRDQIASPIRQPLLLLLGASVMVILVGCTNLASALLARGSARRSELAVLRALGAERRDVVRRLFSESLVLALFGAAAGLLLAWSLIRALPAIVPSALPRMDEVAVHPAVAGFSVLVSVAAAFLFGLFPALRASDRDLGRAMRSAERGSSAGGRGVWRLLMVGEVALALLLLAGAGLLIRSFWNVMQVEAGFQPDGVVSMRVSLPAGKYGDEIQRAAFYEALLQELRRVPDVESAGMSLTAPLVGSPSTGLIRVDGGPLPDLTATYQVADAGYFETLRIPLQRGRLFESTDNADVAHVVVVNQAMADLAWPGENPIGKRITAGGMDNYWNQPDAWATVVGVVGNIRQRDLTRSSYPTYYFTYRQRAFRARGADVLVRAERGAPTDLVGGLRQTALRIDADVPVRFRTMDEIVSSSLGDRRFTMGVLGAFAALALMLAALGIYGVVAYTVALRTREMGIRLALGAAPSGVLGMVLREAMATVAVGLLAGLAGAVALTRLLQSFLFEVGPADPVALTATALILLAVAALASFIPARRAASIDPLSTMRAD